MLRTAIVRLSDYAIVHKYDGSRDTNKYAGQWRRSDLFDHVQYDDAVTGSHITASDNFGSTIIEKDIQTDRDVKLIKLRELRDEKLVEADHMVNDLALGVRSDTVEVSTYRSALKDITDSYKDSEDENVGTSALDPFEEDLSDFTFPTKP